MDKFAMEPIAYMKSVFKVKNGTPRQPGLVPSSSGQITINRKLFTNPEHTLEGLEEYSHVWIIFVFHDNGNSHVRAKVKPPRLNGRKVGVFASRAPHRPNPIGLSLVKLDRVAGPTLHVSGIDLIDGTPVLDIKPYIPQYDSIQFNPATLQSKEYFHFSESAETNQCQEDLKISSCDLALSPCANEGNESCNNAAEVTRDDIINSKWANNCEIDDHNSNCNLVKSQKRHDDRQGGNRSTYQRGKKASPAVRNQESNPQTTVAKSDVNSLAQLEEDPHFTAPAALDCVIVETKLTNDVISDEENCQMKGQPQFKVGLQTNDNQASIQVANWLTNYAGSQLNVRWTDRACRQLEEICKNCSNTRHSGTTAIKLKTLLESVLHNDPRSAYRRTKCSDRLYFFSVEGVHATTWFDDNEVEIVRIKPG